MRTYAIEVLVRESASGYARTVKGSQQFKEAEKLFKQKRATIVLKEKSFAGYGGSRDVGYTKYVYTITEK
jgi:hypothetical protein